MSRKRVAFNLLNYFFLKLDILLYAIKTFLIINIVTVVTPTVAALSLIALSLVTRMAGFTPK